MDIIDNLFIFLIFRNKLSFLPYIFICIQIQNRITKFKMIQKRIKIEKKYSFSLLIPSTWASKSKQDDWTIFTIEQFTFIGSFKY